MLETDSYSQVNSPDHDAAWSGGQALPGESSNPVLSPREEVAQLIASIEVLPGPLDHKELVLEGVTSLLRDAVRTENPAELRDFGRDPTIRKLSIHSSDGVRNLTDRTIHGKILDFMASCGQETTEGERAAIVGYFDGKDAEHKAAVLGSYAEHGLLTMESARAHGIVTSGSATPGDSVGIHHKLATSLEGDVGSVRGYIVTSDEDDGLFVGRNSFSQVALEREDESIDRAQTLAHDEVENRLRNTVMFIVDPTKVPVIPRDENEHDEDIISDDVPPEAIEAVLVDHANLALAQAAFAGRQTQVIGVEKGETHLDMLFDGPYEMPDYKTAIEGIVATAGPRWCHIARLPVDTYPA